MIRKILPLKRTLAFIALLIFHITIGVVWAEERLWTEKIDSSSDESVVLDTKLFSRLAEKLSPAVVNIRSIQKVRDRYYSESPFGVHPGVPRPKQPEDFRQQGEGSGFIFNKNGFILTNAHVVAGSDELQVSLADGRLFKGRLIGIDKTGDVALVKIDSDIDLPFLPLGSSDNLKAGDWVMAIGSPFGFDETVTVGIVSGKGRSIGESPYDDFIQTDTSINPGNSGGPLINTAGEVVGINTLIIAQAQGMGFSLPIDLVKTYLPQLKEKGRVVRSWLGVVVQDITLESKESLGLSIDYGSLVKEVVAQSPAFRASIKPGDVIIEFSGFPIKNSIELPKRVAHSIPEKKYSMKLMRKENILSLMVLLKEVPNAQTR
ncbi:MAG: trypsin-like peptidase domain-containing protein [Nitrospinales bacterium]